MLKEDEVKYIAALARIGLTDGEVGKFQKDLSTVLDWFDELKAADTSSVAEAIVTTGETNRMVADASIPKDANEHERIVENFPEKKDGFNKVKSVF